MGRFIVSQMIYNTWRLCIWFESSVWCTAFSKTDFLAASMVQWLYSAWWCLIDVTIWKHFPHYRFLCEGNSPVDSPCKDQLCFPWCSPVQAFERTVELPMIWEAMPLMWLSLWLTLPQVRRCTAQKDPWQSITLHCISILLRDSNTAS